MSEEQGGQGAHRLGSLVFPVNSHIRQRVRMKDHRSSRVPSTRVKLLAAAMIGAAGGWLFFYHLQPWLMGSTPRPVLERSGTVFLMFRTFPFIIVPFVTLAIAYFQPRSKGDAFWLALVLSSMLLIPIPVVDEWRTRPSDFGFAPFSKEILLEVAAVVLVMSLMAVTASVVSAFLSPALSRVIPLRHNVE